MPDKIKTRSTEGKNIKTEIYFYPHSEIFVREDLGKEGVRRVLDGTEYRSLSVLSTTDNL